MSQMENVFISKVEIVTGSMHAILPQSTGRYDVHKRVQRSNAIVEPAMFASARDASPTYLLPGWSDAVHPEGKVYFHRSGDLRVVTECDMHDPEVAAKVAAWTSHVLQCAVDQEITFTSTMELFLQPDEDDCNYYIVDHATQTVFWLTRDETDDLGLLPVVSPSHLQLQLQAQYWAHVENFCMHIGGLPQKCIDELILIFSHGLADNLTSTLSTFPYDAAATEKFLNLLRSSRDQIHEGYVVAIVARLWGLIMYNRYETHYGQDQARLSRDSSILVDEVDEIKWTKTAVSILTFRMSETYNNRLNSLFVDQFVFGNDWTSFMTHCMTSWQHSTVASAALLLFHAFCFFLPISPALAYSSATLSTLSILTSAVLINRHDELSAASAVPAHEFLSSIISPIFKFQGAAFIYSLPKVLFVYGLLAFVSQWIIILCQFLPLSQVAFFISVIATVFFALHVATSRTRLRAPILPSWRHNAKETSIA
ncbi:hypothetical protein BDN70DRAFT_848640 [Pholiota conissans]|uniref:Uncharacterized protein n=1 Tax=Pholiota conissans TaxID=109636 RepID=A0A9P6CYA3_9AGAR|nr:hypothetical protein BDN70DRAFT_848640 [Pholiota conissans]